MVLSQRASMAREADRVLRTIFRRCVECDDTTPPCPPCQGNQICSLVPANCDSCAQMVCVDNPNPPSQAPAGPNIAAIAGGVVGGVAFIVIIVFLVWFLWIRKRRAQQELEAEEWDEDEIARQKAAFQNMVHDAASTRTRGSFANSVLSRASNVIQIAFIPGVTTRNGSSQDSALTSTPVPPIPAARGTPRAQGDPIFFRPGDIRDSNYSGTSSIMLDRRDTQYTMSSRDSSIGPSSIYQDSISIQPLPAAQASRAVPRMVSVKSSNTGSSADSASANSPASAGGKSVQVLMPGQGNGTATSGSVRSQGSFGRAQQITVGGKTKGRFPVKTSVDAHSATQASAQHVPDVSSPLRSANNDSDSDEEETAAAKKSLLKIAQSSPEQSKDNPFFDPADAAGPQAATTALQSATKAQPYASLASTISAANDDSSLRRGKSMGGLSAVIEEATKKASSPPLHDGLGGKRDSSPFDDSHKVG